MSVTRSVFGQCLLNTQCLDSVCYTLSVWTVSVKHSVFAQCLLHTQCLDSVCYTLSVWTVSVKHSVYAWNTATDFVYEYNRTKTDDVLRPAVTSQLFCLKEWNNTIEKVS